MTETTKAKRCRVCGETKNLAEFNHNSHRADGRRLECRSCQAEHRKTYEAKRREQKQEHFAALVRLRDEEEEKRVHAALPWAVRDPLELAKADEMARKERESRILRELQEARKEHARLAQGT
jgi:hypothetical protein